jgi:sugar phosphate isomerase/epimerase
VRISIGNQTAWTAGLMEPFEFAVASGFDAFEWFPDKKGDSGWDERDLTHALRQSIRETAAAHGIRQSVHARLLADPLPADARSMLYDDLRLASDLGAALLNIHLPPEADPADFLHGIAPLAERAAAAGLQLSIENTPYHTPEVFNELFLRLRSLDPVPTRHIGMCLDVGHANLCSATQNNYLEFLNRLDPHVPITHLHLHENWGDADSHLPLFTGPAGENDSGIRELAKRLQDREFSGSIILEQWPHPPGLLIQARDRLRQLF